jgi:predicted tellurium resistance membrane protein TerC
MIKTTKSKGIYMTHNQEEESLFLKSKIRYSARLIANELIERKEKETKKELNEEQLRLGAAKKVSKEVGEKIRLKLSLFLAYFGVMFIALLFSVDDVISAVGVLLAILALFFALSLESISETYLLVNIRRDIEQRFSRSYWLLEINDDKNQ